MVVVDKRGKEYELEINEDGTVNIFQAKVRIAMLGFLVTHYGC